MSEGQNLDSQDPREVSRKALALSDFVRKNLDGEFAEVFTQGSDMELPETTDTVNGENGKRLGVLTARRASIPEYDDYDLSFIPHNDADVDTESVFFRIPKYKGFVIARYEYTKTFKTTKKPTINLKGSENSESTEAAIQEFALRVGKMLGVPPQE